MAPDQPCALFSSQECHLPGAPPGNRVFHVGHSITRLSHLFVVRCGTGPWREKIARPQTEICPLKFESPSANSPWRRVWGNRGQDHKHSPFRRPIHRARQCLSDLFPGAVMSNLCMGALDEKEYFHCVVPKAAPAPPVGLVLQWTRTHSQTGPINRMGMARGLRPQEEEASTHRGPHRSGSSAHKASPWPVLTHPHHS